MGGLAVGGNYLIAPLSLSSLVMWVNVATDRCLPSLVDSLKRFAPHFSIMKLPTVNVLFLRMPILATAAEKSFAFIALPLSFL